MQGKRILLLGGIAFLIVALAAGYWIFIRPLTLPVYELAEQPSQGDGQFTVVTLTGPDGVYVREPGEVALEMTAQWRGWNSLIGRTSDGLDLYAIPQQDSGDYIILTTLMYPNEVFRRSSLPPVDLTTFKADELNVVRGMPGEPVIASSREADLLAAVVNDLSSGEAAAQSVSDAQFFSISLLSGQLPGLAYVINVTVAPDGKIYLAERLAPDVWFPAGSIVTGWFNENVLK